jgi:hypothetical protein
LSVRVAKAHPQDPVIVAKLPKISKIGFLLQN